MMQLGEVERPPDQFLVDTRVVALDAGDQLADEVLVMAFGINDSHGSSVLSPDLGTGSARKAAKLRGSCSTCDTSSNADGCDGSCSNWRARLRVRRLDKPRPTLRAGPTQ